MCSPSPPARRLRPDWDIIGLMIMMLQDTWRFLRGRPDHPVYRRELAGWSYLRLWRGIRRGCLPLIGLAMLGMSGVCGLLTIGTLTGPGMTIEVVYKVLLVLGALVIGIFYTGEIVLWAVGLLATVLTATSISAEIEADTYSLLRLTLVPAREIVLAKFAAAMRELRRPILIVMITRALLLVAGPTLLLSALVYAAATTPTAGSAPPSAAFLSPPSLPGGQALLPLIFSTLLGAISAIVAVLLWLVYFFAQPALEVLLYGAVGMAASTLARSRSSGLFGAFAFRVGLWAASYVLSQVAGVALSLGITPLMMLPGASTWFSDLTATNPALLVIGYSAASILWTLAIMVVPVVFTLVLLRFAARRAERLPLNA